MTSMSELCGQLTGGAMLRGGRPSWRDLVKHRSCEDPQNFFRLSSLFLKNKNLLVKHKTKVIELKSCNLCNNLFNVKIQQLC